MTGLRAAIPLVATLLLAGCLPPPQAPRTAAPPFVFRALELRQRDAQGRPAWEITSPEARYDLGRKLAQARELRGLIYAKGKPIYRVSATRGVVLNDGEVVQLEGPTKVERLGPDPLVITALRVRWYPQQGRMQLDRQPLARQKQLELTSRRAVFDFTEDKLVLHGRPLLVDRGQPQFRLAVKRLQWWAANGNLAGDGPVRGQRIAPGNRRQTLTSPSLSGNSQRQEVILSGPVRVVDAAEQAELRAQVTRIDLQQETISSDQPFEGQRGTMALRGQAFTLLGKTTTVVIPRGCVLTQPGDQLTASQCSWNWSTNQVQANGEVELRRQENGQVTRADQLEGRATRDGSVVFSRPDGRVTTELRIPPRRQQPGGARRSRPAIQL